MSKRIIQFIKSDFFSVLVSNTLVKFLAFFPSVFLARLLTKNELAAVSYADNILSYLLTFAGLGFSSSILRYCAKQDDDNKYYGYFDVAVRYGTISHLAFAFIFAIVTVFVDFGYEHAKFIFYLLIFTPALQNIYDSCINFIRTQGKYKLYSKINVEYSIVKLLLLIGLTYFFSINGMIAARYFSIIMVMVAIVGGARSVLKKRDYSLSKREKIEFCKYSLYTVIITACSNLMPLNAMFIINNVLADSVATANYKVAMALPYNMMFITGAIVIYFTPIFALHDNEPRWIRSKSLKVGGATVLLYALVALFFFVFADLLIQLIYGVKYLDAAPLMRGLAIAYAVEAGLQMIPMNILYAIGYVKNNMFNLAITMILALILDVVFVKSYGIVGIVYATVISSLCSAIEYWLYLIFITRRKS